MTWRARVIMQLIGRTTASVYLGGLREPHRDNNSKGDIIILSADNFTVKRSLLAVFNQRRKARHFRFQNCLKLDQVKLDRKLSVYAGYVSVGRKGLSKARGSRKRRDLHCKPPEVTK
ncbi:hypothetical protein CEXT_82211 [Caerostris extrusa]|uniref:Uncharacterized protein n=1 Tax=Caerostris extrusa TaxID=172846 RepID=A0AAV4QGI0_CAEEX|nr:hypothetical protein CEXT_82211 [Caerostris extrusa]